MTTAEKKQAILNVIYERAYELVEKAEEYRGILFPENANHNEIENAALKKAFEEWKENKPVFNKPAFLTPDISRFSIPETLELIKEQTGLKLELCDYFTGIKEHNGRKYFNIILRQRVSESKEYDILKRFADKYKMISVEPNGLNRVAVFQNGFNLTQKTE